MKRMASWSFSNQTCMEVSWGPVLAHPPERQGAEDGEAFAGRGGGRVGLEDVGPDDRVAVQEGVAVGEALVNVRLVGGVEGGQGGFPGGVEVIG